MEPLVLIRWVEAGLWLVSIEGMICNWTEEFQRASRWPPSTLELIQLGAGEGRTMVVEDPGDGAPDSPHPNAPGARTWRFDAASVAPENRNVIAPAVGHGPGRWIRIGSTEDKIARIRALRVQAAQGDAAGQYATGYTVALDAVMVILDGPGEAGQPS